MLLKITSKRQVTFPKRIMEKFHLREGDHLSIAETADGILIKPRRFDRAKLAPLRGQIASGLSAPEIEEMRHASLDPSLRD